jgi:parallel beta-helix repeat protein
MRSRSGWVVGIAMLAGTSAARAADCGGNVACECGDRVVRDHVLTSDLGPCPGHGLVVASGVTLDGAGHHIHGSGADESYGVYFRGVTEAVVADVEVTGFHHGIRLRDAHACQVRESDVHGNGDFAKKAGYGIDVAALSSANLFEGNAIHANADEGIHLGSGSRANELRANRIHDNERENVYLLASDENVIAENDVWGGRNSLFVKDSSRNRIEANVLSDATLVLRANSHDNELIDNQLVEAGIHFQLYTDEKPYRSPHDNELRGGSIRDASPCVRFSSAVGNRVVGTQLAGCTTQVRSESDHGPAENTLVGVAFERSRLDLDRGSILRVRDEHGAVLETFGQLPGDPPAAARDLAISRILAPRYVRLTASRPSRLRRVEVMIANRGTGPERVDDAATLAGLVHLEAVSAGTCRPPEIRSVGARRALPFQVEAGEFFAVVFEVELDCANDPGRRAPSGGDFVWSASIDPSVLGGEDDVDASNDGCPRSSASGGSCGSGGIVTDVAR